MSPDSTSVTVGHEAADFTGTTHTALQAAVDHVAQLGGGTIDVLPGTYHMGNALHLRSNVQLIGHETETRLVKNASHVTPLTDDVDWYMWTARVADPSGFEAGGGLLLVSTDPHGGVANVTKHTIEAIDGNELRMDVQPRKNHWITHNARAATLFPVVTANWAENISIAHLVIDGNRAKNDPLDGNHGGCIFMQDCKQVTIDSVHACNNNGDGISWQICDDVTVRDCKSTGHAGLGLHPGSGSQRPVIKNNLIEDCETGLFWCWGVQHGLAEENEIRNCSHYGISIGHRDTDNIMRRNRILNAGIAGLVFRIEGEDTPCRQPHRNRIESNLFEGGGSAKQAGIGIDIQVPIEDVHLIENRFTNPSAGHLQTGIRIGSGKADVRLAGNTFENLACDVERVP